jgi:hypothetical protein
MCLVRSLQTAIWVLLFLLLLVECPLEQPNAALFIADHQGLFQF